MNLRVFQADTHERSDVQKSHIAVTLIDAMSDFEVGYAIFSLQPLDFDVEMVLFGTSFSP